jgi:P-type E1-E2 ATPase
MESLGVSIARGALRDVEELEMRGATALYLATDGALAGMVACADTMRPETPAVVSALRERGIRDIIILTGDRPGAARHVAEAAGISKVIAEVMPQDKARYVAQIMARDGKVAYIGDGINDSPALVTANVGIAVNGGSDVARETADIILLTGGLRRVPLAVDIARDAMRLVRQNWRLVWAPNAGAAALAALGLGGPAMATLISNGSTIAASLNALRPLYASQPVEPETPVEQAARMVEEPGAAPDEPEPAPVTVI